MTEQPNTPQPNSDKQHSPSSGGANRPDNTGIKPPYRQTNTSGGAAKWVVPLLALTLGAGVFAGKLWGEKQAAEALQVQTDAAQTPVNPQIATATGVTEKAVVQKAVLTVEVVTPTQTTVENALSADGTIVPKDVATVNGKVNGVTLEQVLVNEGDEVKQGQVLAVFDTDAMRQQLAGARADLAEAQTRLQLAKVDADRVIPLLDIDAVSKQEVDRYIATANQAAAAVEAAKSRVNSQTLNLENAKVTAPVSGIISEKNANVGSAPNGQAPLFTIIENGVLEWQAKVDPNKLGEITVGTPVKVSLPNNKSVMGQVSRIAPIAEEGSRQVSVFATLAKSALVRSGMYQRGTFVLGGESKQVLPVSAIVTQDGYDYVMLVNKDKNAKGDTIYRIKREKVTLGERQGDAVVVTKPLPNNVAVVRQGGSFLNDGDIVRIAMPNGNADTTGNAATATANAG